MQKQEADSGAGLGDQLARCGTRLRGLRAARGWTLEELAERSGLSKPFLSRLEAGDRRPSIAAILTLARIYEVSVGALFDTADAEPCVVVRSDQAPRREGDGLIYKPLSNSARFANLQPIRLTVCADRVGDERYQHDGEEWVYVLSGQLRITVAGNNYDLEPGDAAHFDSRHPHRVTALGGRDAELILVACPVPEPSAQLPRPRRQRRAIG